MLNTPASYSWYLAGLVFEWLEEQGGLRRWVKLIIKKPNCCMTPSMPVLYITTLSIPYRSIMNVPFFTGDAELDKRFVAEAKDAGLLALKGHREVGGMRASIYNAISMDAVRALCTLCETLRAGLSLKLMDY